MKLAGGRDKDMAEIVFIEKSMKIRAKDSRVQGYAAIGL
jgi:hypothetical protein